MPTELGYFTIGVADLAKGKAFYGALFGWEFEESGHVTNTKFPLGMSATGPLDITFAYFRVEDIEAACARVTEIGGTVRQRNTYPSGPNAVCVDDQGTVFSLWQPAPGFE